MPEHQYRFRLSTSSHRGATWLKWGREAGWDPRCCRLYLQSRCISATDRPVAKARRSPSTTGETSIQHLEANGCLQAHKWPSVYLERGGIWQYYQQVCNQNLTIYEVSVNQYAQCANSGT